MHFRFFYYSAELRHKKSENEKIIWRLWKWTGAAHSYRLPSFVMVRARREPQGTMVLISRNSSGEHIIPPVGPIPSMVGVPSADTKFPSLTPPGWDVISSVSGSSMGMYMFVFCKCLSIRRTPNEVGNKQETWYNVWKQTLYHRASGFCVHRRKPGA